MLQFVSSRSSNLLRAKVQPTARQRLAIASLEALEGRALFSASLKPAIQVATPDVHPIVLALSNRPGAAYTLYLDFGGFNFTGDWNGDGDPGNTPAYDSDGDATTFTSAEKTAIKTIWAGVAGKYAGYSINVTTVDPAADMSDAQRQAYYDATPHLMHTVIGGDGAWEHGIAGVSQLNVDRNSYGNPTTDNGAHTNWIFAGQDPTNLDFVYAGATHENGHGLGLHHQSDVTVNPVVEYDDGDGTIGDPNSYSPIMGGQDGQERYLWRIGTQDTGVIQNDVAAILSNPGMTLTDDGVGHSLAMATALPLTGSAINTAAAGGFINTASASTPVALGVDNYTKDYYTFSTSGSAISLTLHAGHDDITTGVADLGLTFDGKFNILNSAGTVVATSTRAADGISYSYNGTLAAGNYTLQILDIGGYTSARESTANYFTSGNYFLSGTGFSSGEVVPPTTGSISGVVFNDANDDGMQDNNEGGLTGVQIVLHDISGAAADEFATTGAGGAYSFADVPAESYTIYQVTLDGYTQTAPSGDFYKIAVAAGKNTVTPAFGEYKTPVVPPPPGTGTITGTLFNDTNGNGIKDASDGVTGIRQVFIDTNGNGKLDSGETSTMSDVNGKYTFTGVAAGAMNISRVFPKGFRLSNASTFGGLDVVATVTSGATATADVGTYGSAKAPTPPPAITGTIAGTLWNDTNGDGIYEPKVEAGTGVRTVFIDANENGILDNGEQSTLSDAQGHYSFTTMPLGTFAISRVFPNGYSLSDPSAGTFGEDVLVTLTGSGTVIANLGTRAARVM